MFHLAAPADRDGIGQAVADALGIDVRAVVLVGDILEIDAPDSAKDAARAAVAGHTPLLRVDHDAAFRSAVAAATTIAQLRDALLGNAGPGAEPRRHVSEAP